MKKSNAFTIISLGCSKNTVDSEVLSRQLHLNHYSVNWEKFEDASPNVIINTCGFIDDAKQESIDTILYFAQKKQLHEIERLYVIGCLSQRYKKELTAEIPEVDAFLGTNDLPVLLRLINADYYPQHIIERTLSTPSHYAYLKIAEGCNRNCSFCAIPLIRGQHKSKPLKQIVEEAKLLINKGVQEIILISQDVVFYGYDKTRKYQLIDLVKALLKLEGYKWLRLQYLHPKLFPLELLNIMKENPKLLPYIDIPVQHISDSVLNAMHRGISKKETLDLLSKIRKEIPNAVIRTTLLVGHPGETKQDFDELRTFVSDFQFDRLGVFTYSHEEGTPAGNLNDDVPNNIKSRRKNTLLKLQQEISLQKNKKRIGQVLEVVIDRVEESVSIGRSVYDSPEVDNEVIIENEQLNVGQFYNVEIIDAQEYDLFGKIV
jgi:ribosomal protein S12 methylthiotransferase